MIRILAVAALALATGVSAQDRECRFEAERSATVVASAADRLELVARSGSLRVEGLSGLSEVRVRGHACASSEELLDQLRLETGRSGGVVRVEVPEIDQGGWNWGRDTYALLDLVLEVPEGIAATVEDGSGDAILRGLGRSRVDDGSGGLTIENIMGDLAVDDGSGTLAIRGVDGDLRIEDGSGEIEISDVTGTVSVEDGSGDIRVEDVAGDFTVVDDGSGSIRHSGVQGRVRIPERNRRNRT